MEVKKRNKNDLEWWLWNNILLKDSLLSWKSMLHNKVWRERERERGKKNGIDFNWHSKMQKEHP